MPKILGHLRSESPIFDNGSTKIMGTSFPSQKKKTGEKKNTVVSPGGFPRGRDRPRDRKL